jgi:dephospho-CoA kinase
VIGVLGGIASGKSTVARLLAGTSGVVIDADRIAREVLDARETRDYLAQAFGPGVLSADGSPDRDALAQRVFASPRDRAALESFTHPRIRARIQAALDDARRRGASRIVLDVPLLLENESEHGLAAQCDALVFVAADADSRDARAAALRGWPVGEVARREAAQLPLSAKRARADHVIENRGNLADLERAVADVADALAAGGKR